MWIAHMNIYKHKGSTIRYIYIETFRVFGFLYSSYIIWVVICEDSTLLYPVYDLFFFIVIFSIIYILNPYISYLVFFSHSFIILLDIYIFFQILLEMNKICIKKGERERDFYAQLLLVYVEDFTISWVLCFGSVVLYLINT